MIILIALILAITIPISSAHRRRRRRSHHDHNSDSSDETEHSLRDLCSETDRSDACWDILKPEIRRFDGSDDGDIADHVIDLAADKSKEIRDKLKQWHSDSDNDELKKKYHSCSKNYNDVDHSLKEARKNLDSDQVEEAEKELEKCEREFDGDSFDPAHVGDRNKELRLYLDMVRVASDRLENYDQEEYED